MLVRLAPRVILVYALHLLLLTVTVSAQYIGNADPEKRADRRENRRDARSTRTRYRSSRTNRYRGRDRRLAARRLLQADSPAWAPVGAPSPDDDAYWPFPNNDVPDVSEETEETGVVGAFEHVERIFPGECLTLLEIIDNHPDLSLLSNVTSTLPIVRQALVQRDTQDTFFAPTNDAIYVLRDLAGIGGESLFAHVQGSNGAGVARCESFEVGKYVVFASGDPVILRLFLGLLKGFV